MGFKDYIKGHSEIIKKEPKNIIVEKTKTILKTKKLSEYSTEELYEELNKREDKKKKEILENKQDPMLYASMILEDSDFDNNKIGIKKQLKNNTDDIMNRAMDILQGV